MIRPTPVSPHEHVVRLFGQHEPTGASEGIEARLRQGEKLVLAVLVGERREHEELEPVGHRRIEGAEDPRLVLVAASAFEQLFGFFAPVAPEVLMKQVDHRPQVSALFDVHLKEVPHVVQAGGGLA